MSLTDVKTAWSLQRAAVRGAAAYRFNFLVATIIGIAYQGSGFAFIWVVLAKFHTIGGWDFGSVAFLYALRVLAHALWLLPFNRLGELDFVIREGEFDRYLVRPLNPLLQLVTSRFRINVFGDVAIGCVLFGFATSMADVDWSPLHVLYLIAVVIGGAMAEGAFVLGAASFSFRFLETTSLRSLIDNVYLLFGSYPTKIFGAATQWVLTWVVPVAFVAYIPSSVLLNRTGELRVPFGVAVAAPFIGAAFFAVAYQLWRWQLRSYQSSGH